MMAIPTPTGTPSAETREDELVRLRRIAARHGLPGDELIRLVTEARGEARNRRRRLPDVRLEELISELGGDQ